MLLEQKVFVKNVKRNRDLYENVPHETDDKYIQIDIHDLSEGSSIRVLARCDHCGEIYTPKMTDLTRTMKRNGGTNYCKNCKLYAHKLSIQRKYGVNNVSQLDSVKEKKKETCYAHFGVDYPMQSDEVLIKSRETMKNKYGFEHNLQRPEICDKVKKANSEVRGRNVTINSSKAQRYICQLLEGVLNYPCGYYNLDILLDDNVYIEYNGSGHNMNVKRGQITEEEFRRKEVARYYYVKSFGYKCIIIDNKSDKLPLDEILLQIISQCSELLQNNNWVRCNLDTLQITTKQTSI